MIKVIDLDLLDDEELTTYIDRNFENIMHRLGRDDLLVEDKKEEYLHLA